MNSANVMGPRSAMRLRASASAPVGANKPVMRRDRRMSAFYPLSLEGRGLG